MKKFKKAEKINIDGKEVVNPYANLYTPPKPQITEEKLEKMKARGKRYRRTHAAISATFGVKTYD